MNNDTDDKFLIVQEETLFSKIKGFFKNLFSKKSDNKVEKNNIENSDFNSYIKVDILKKEEFDQLQKDFTSGKIKESDLTQEQKEELNQFYDQKILELKNSIKAKDEELKKLKETA